MRPQTSAALLLIAATIAVVLAGETGDAAAGTSLAPQVKLDARRRGKAGVDVYIWIAPGVNVAGFQFELLFDRNVSSEFDGMTANHSTLMPLPILKSSGGLQKKAGFQVSHSKPGFSNKGRVIGISPSGVTIPPSPANIPELLVALDACPKAKCTMEAYEGQNICVRGAQIVSDGQIEGVDVNLRTQILSTSCPASSVSSPNVDSASVGFRGFPAHQSADAFSDEKRKEKEQGDASQKKKKKKKAHEEFKK